jgi:MarR family transcriptional regulator, organic hydroperoxide resistance regulator
MRAAEDLRYLVLAAQREGNRLLARQLAPLGLTPSQAEVLRVLSDFQPLSLKGLGELLVCETGTNPSRLAERLVAMGLIQRRPGDADRREVELTLTALGRSRVQHITRIEEAMYQLIDGAAAGHDLDEILAFLRGFVAELPAGQALARRKALARTARDQGRTPRSPAGVPPHDRSTDGGRDED